MVWYKHWRQRTTAIATVATVRVAVEPDTLTERRSRGAVRSASLSTPAWVVTSRVRSRTVTPHVVPVPSERALCPVRSGAVVQGVG
jgi:hypothetical protein